MSEQSDAVVLVVSEETGAISIAFDARLFYDLSAIEVSRKLKELLDRGSRRFVEREDTSSGYIGSTAMNDAAINE